MHTNKSTNVLQDKDCNSTLPWACRQSLPVERRHTRVLSRPQSRDYNPLSCSVPTHPLPAPCSHSEHAQWSRRRRRTVWRDWYKYDNYNSWEWGGVLFQIQHHFGAQFQQHFCNYEMPCYGIQLTSLIAMLFAFKCSKSLVAPETLPCWQYPSIRYE